MATTKSRERGNPRQPVLTNAARLITERLDEMLAYESCLDDPDNVYKLHEMRIAGKRLRYTMEIFQPVYVRYTDVGTEFGAILLAVKNLQEHLGILHDADVLVPQILEHLGRVVKNGYGAPGALTALDVNGPRGKSVKDKDRRRKVQLQKSDKQEEALPIVGVHQVDYDACEGLLTLCTQIRAERDAQYIKLIQEWKQMRVEQVFERLRDLVARAHSQEREEKEKRRKGDKETKGRGAPILSSPLSTQEPSAPNSPLLTVEDSDADNRQTPQIQRAPGEPGHVAAARRRAPLRAPDKGSESERQERKSRQRRDASPLARTAGSPVPDARNGATHRERHSRPGADPSAGAGEGGAE